ncbi:MAG TPA: hypothetical protein VFZ25_02840 [Chloroflexota bacterium]|nr:hypothetical protein [Chloroflexota bacterium]
MKRLREQRSRAQRVSADDVQHPGGIAGGQRRESDSPRTASGPIPVTPQGMVQLQPTLGNHAIGQLLEGYREERHRGNRPTDPSNAVGSAPIQRMIQISDKLFYSPEAIKRQLPGKTDKNVELGQWRKNLEDLTAKSATSVENAYAIPGMRAASPTEGDALTGKLSSGGTIFHYASVSLMNNFLNNLQGGGSEDTSPMLLPKDLLDEKRDLKLKYDAGKACVLQALINLGIRNPGLESGQQSDPEAWHTYYVTRNIMYDDDTVLYKIYSGFGLRMVWNRRTTWANLDPRVITPGSYVFSTPGHNFAVTVNDDPDPSRRYEPKDTPQNIVTSYEAGRTISYVWRYA